MEGQAHPHPEPPPYQIDGEGISGFCLLVSYLFLLTQAKACGYLLSMSCLPAETCAAAAQHQTSLVIKTTGKVYQYCRTDGCFRNILIVTADAIRGDIIRNTIG